jgi:hypothetical protein
VADARWLLLAHQLPTRSSNARVKTWRRFIDPNATFRFRNRPKGVEVPFDMYAGDFSHQGSMCTFETLATAHGRPCSAGTRY